MIYFSRMEERDDQMIKRLTIEIDEEIRKNAKARAYAEGRTLKEKIVELIREWLKTSTK